MKRLLVICTVIGALHSTTNVHAQSLRGIVVDSATGNAVRAATVTVFKGRNMLADVKADSAGRFVIPLKPASELTLYVTALGFASYTLRLRSNMELLSVRLKPEPVAIEGVDVNAERRDRYLDMVGFYQRKRREIGSFITREQIELRKPGKVSHLFETMASAQVLCGSGRSCVVASRRFKSPQAATCRPTVYLDGMNMGRAFVDELGPADDLAGVEAYLGTARVPAQYGGANSACGVILLWTRLKN